MTTRPQRPHEGQINPAQEEALRILQEECAEVIQAASKVCRAGPDYIIKDSTMRQNLEREIGDVLALVDELVKHGLIDLDSINQWRANKTRKLYLWSDYLGIGSFDKRSETFNTNVDDPKS